MLSHLVSNFGL